MNKTLSRFIMIVILVLWGVLARYYINETNRVFDEITLSQPDIFKVSWPKTSPEARELANHRVTGNNLCDQYIATLSCLSDYDSSETLSDTRNSFVAWLTDIWNDQLEEICSGLIKELEESSLYLAYQNECGVGESDATNEETSASSELRDETTD